MKKSVLYSVLEGVLLILPPLLFSTVLSAIYIFAGQYAAPFCGVLIWLAWLACFVFAVRRKSAGSALCLAVLLFLSCGFYGLSLAADYEFFTFPAGIHALFTLFGAPYDVAVSGLRLLLPEEGAAAILVCVIYLLLVIVSSGYAAVQFGKKKKKKH